MSDTNEQTTTTDTSKYPREFAFGAINIADPNPAWTPEKVMQHLASNGYPDMVTATIDGPMVKGKKNVYTINAKLRTKG